MPKLNSSRSFQCVAVLVAGLLLAGFAHVPILRQIASFLIVEDSLRPAAAIVALSGQTPFREIEAAKLYRAGLAPIVIIVREAANKESQALRQLGIKKPENWVLGRAVLIQQGVPDTAILIPEGEGIGTLEELQAVYKALASQRSDIASSEHGAGSKEPEIRSSGAVLGSAERNPPVILVTSKYHTRRTRLTWHYVTGGHSQAITRAAGDDPFDPERWWQQRGFALSVAREYLGLMNYYAGFAVGAGQ